MRKRHDRTSLGVRVGVDSGEVNKHASLSLNIKKKKRASSHTPTTHTTRTPRKNSHTLVDLTRTTAVWRCHRKIMRGEAATTTSIA